MIDRGSTSPCSGGRADRSHLDDWRPAHSRQTRIALLPERTVSVSKLMGGHMGRQADAFGEEAMTRRDWWIGILVLVAALAAHAAMNRYSWHLYDVEGQGQNARALLKIDRFTGAITHEPVPRLDMGVLYGRTH